MYILLLWLTPCPVIIQLAYGSIDWNGRMYTQNPSLLIFHILSLTSCHFPTLCMCTWCLLQPSSSVHHNTFYFTTLNIILELSNVFLPSWNQVRISISYASWLFYFHKYQLTLQPRTQLQIDMSIWICNLQKFRNKGEVNMFRAMQNKLVLFHSNISQMNCVTTMPNVFSQECKGSWKTSTHFMITIYNLIFIPMS